MKKTFRKGLSGLHLLAALHAAFLVSIFFMLVNSSYEDKVFDKLVSRSTAPQMTGQETALRLMHVTHDLLEPRSKIWGGSRPGVREFLFGSSDANLMAPRGGCGSFTYVLARALQRYGIDVRIAQMRTGESPAGHIILEAKIDGRWAVLDPFYDAAFRRPDGTLASFQDVRQDWRYFKKQVPSDYHPSYKYEDVRYTNWNKIPVIMPALKSALIAAIGKDRTEKLSLRVYFLNVYKAYAVILVILYIPVILITIRILRRRLYVE